MCACVCAYQRVNVTNPAMHAQDAMVDQRRQRQTIKQRQKRLKHGITHPGIPLHGVGFDKPLSAIDFKPIFAVAIDAFVVAAEEKDTVGVFHLEG